MVFSFLQLRLEIHVLGGLNRTLQVWGIVIKAWDRHSGNVSSVFPGTSILAADATRLPFRVLGVLKTSGVLCLRRLGFSSTR